MHIARLSTTLVLIGGLLAAGCGKVTSPTSTSTRTATKPTYSQRLAPNAPPAVKAVAKALDNLTADDNLTAGDGDEKETADAPAAGGAPAQGGLRPLPKVTPTPAPGKPGGGAEPDEVDDFLSILNHYGYHGDRRQLEDAVTAVTHQYPLGWDSHVNADEHFAWWQKTFQGMVTTPGEYKQQAVYLAQHKFNVVYYIWVSKQTPSQAGGTPPMVSFDKELPIVKGIEDEGLLVQISPRGTIVDYLYMPTDYLHNWNHLIPIPQSMY
jgi:hypothetical protein